MYAVVCGGECRSCVKVEVAVQDLPIPNSLYGLCGHTTTLNLNYLCLTSSEN